MATIFISHSRRDKELVTVIAKVLRNIGCTPLIEEYISEEEKESVPYEEIKKNVNLSDCVFLFLTDNIVATEYTRSWVVFEVGLAANLEKRLFVFERYGIPVPYPIPYLTDYMLFDADSTNDILDIQALSKKLSEQVLSKKLSELTTTSINAGIGALLGFSFSPIGLILGGLVGAILGSEEQTLKVQCHYCGIFFNYYSFQHMVFNCPTCRKKIKLDLRGD